MATARKKAAKPAAPELREPTASETKAFGEAATRQLKRPERAKLKVTETAPRSIAYEPPHKNAAGAYALVREAFGTRSSAFAGHALLELANMAGDPGKPSEEAINAALAILGAIEPRDELEAAMAEQIIAAHVASLQFLNRARANMGEYRDTACAYVNAATKLSRTMAVQIEALAKLRNGGKQTHEVRYVYVNGPVLGAGAQAVFGLPGGGVRGSNFDQPHGGSDPAALAFAPGVPVWREDPTRDALPVAGGEGEEALPDARRSEGLGRTEGEG